MPGQKININKEQSYNKSNLYILLEKAKTDLFQIATGDDPCEYCGSSKCETCRVNTCNEKDIAQRPEQAFT